MNVTRKTAVLWGVAAAALFVATVAGVTIHRSAPSPRPLAATVMTAEASPATATPDPSTEASTPSPSATAGSPVPAPPATTSPAQASHPASPPPPAGPAWHWSQAVSAGGAPFAAISCAPVYTTSQETWCMAAEANGTIISPRLSTSGGLQFTPDSHLANNESVAGVGVLASVSCPGPGYGMCNAVGQSHAIHWGDGPMTWEGPYNADPSGNLMSISCWTDSACAAVDDKGNAVTGAYASWTPPRTIDAGHALLSISCPAANLCVAVDDAGNAVVSSNPTTGWTAPKAIDHGRRLEAVSCATITLCVAVDNAGYAVTSANPLGGAWAAPLFIDTSSTGLVSISCPTTTLCVAGDQHGDVITSANPGSGRWATPIRVDRSGTPLLASCTDRGTCIAVDESAKGGALYGVFG